MRRLASCCRRTMSVTVSAPSSSRAYTRHPRFDHQSLTLSLHHPMRSAHLHPSPPRSHLHPPYQLCHHLQYSRFRKAQRQRRQLRRFHYNSLPRTRFLYHLRCHCSQMRQVRRRAVTYRPRLWEWQIRTSRPLSIRVHP